MSRFRINPNAKPWTTSTGEKMTPERALRRLRLSLSKQDIAFVEATDGRGWITIKTNSQRRGASIPASADPIGVGASGVPTEHSLDRPSLNMNTNNER